MILKHYDSPFHVTHSDKVASKMAMKMDLSIMLSKLIKEKGWTQAEAAKALDIKQPRVSDLVNAKIEMFTVDAMFDMLDKMGYRTRCSLSSLEQAIIEIRKVDKAAA
jgi:predicted XRE-type DNA-binding protein